MKPLTEQSTTELVKLHNSLVPPTKAVKRFSTKDAAVRRVQALLDGKSTTALASELLTSPTEKRACKTSLRDKKAARLFPAPEAAPDLEKPVGNAKAAHAPRKSTVYVEGAPGGVEQYRSVAAAFIALDLPMGKHQRFRAKLKQSGRETIDRYTFHTKQV